ncbi:MAG: glycosyltransferase family 2 protein [Candidatus Saganbacteria bacterium]|nr:glycosyltransferase family 2 protein [Candidatus Saganbacteria bacterium]
MNKKVSIIIPSYNGKCLLAKNLPSIIQNTDPDQHEIIVVDNGSTDDSIEFLKVSFPQIKIVALDNNYGFSHACNAAAKASLGKFLYFLNNDMEVTAGFLPPLIQHFEDPAVFAVSSKILQPHNKMFNEAITMAHFAGGCPNPDNRISRNMASPVSSIEIMYACGGAMFCDRSKFWELGGFDELYDPFYWEDFDLSYQAWKQGYKVLYEPNSLVYHQHGQTTKKYWGANFVRIITIRNRYIFTWKNITDPFMLLSHFFQLVLIKIIVPNYFEWAGLWKAIKLLPKILKKRKTLKAKLTDRQVFEKFAHWIPYLKD